jgi:predicted GNAT family acetyltransferase
VAPRPFDPADLPFVVLGPDDAAEMLSLVERTKPGPFGSRTGELGGFIGLREERNLIAMAGERLRCGGFTEVSGVCTLAEHRGRGLGGALTCTVSHRIQQRGETPFLHAAAVNVGAIRLYRALGFELRRTLDFVVVRAPV